MKTSHAFLAGVTLLLLAVSSNGSILEFKSLGVDFTDQADSHRKATWSDPDKIMITENGLGWDGEAAASRDGWIQTIPLALGRSWRSPYAVSVRVAIHPLPTEIVLDNG